MWGRQKSRQPDQGISLSLWNWLPQQCWAMESTAVVKFESKIYKKWPSLWVKLSKGKSTMIQTVSAVSINSIQAMHWVVPSLFSSTWSLGETTQPWTTLIILFMPRICLLDFSWNKAYVYVYKDSRILYAPFWLLSAQTEFLSEGIQERVDKTLSKVPYPVVNISPTMGNV